MNIPVELVPYLWCLAIATFVMLIVKFILRFDVRHDPYIDHKECDTCGQLGSDVKEGLCQICRKTYVQK